MEFGLLLVVGVVVLVGASLLGSRIGVAAPLLLVVIGIGAGYLPFVPLIEVPPELILVVVLPPLLYSAAVNVPLVDFRRNFRPIIGLSVVLVILSAVIIGMLVHWAIPGIPLSVAIALGAVISPTDAVAATSIGKRLGMPDRVVTILEGESLVNDATSLVLLKTALAAMAGSFVFIEAAGSFAYSVTVAVLVGFLMGVVTVWVRSKFHNPMYDTMVSFVVPFIAFIPAEELGASGVLAVVVTGLYTGHHASRRFSATARTNERMNWRTIQFILENGVFLLMGLQLHTLMEQVGESNFELAHVALISVGLVGVLILLRAIFTMPLVEALRSTAKTYERRGRGLKRLAGRVKDDPDPSTQRLRRVSMRQLQVRADIAHERDQQLGWRDGIVLSWSGMRGVVTLAAAQSIPLGVPYRPQLIIMAFGVAIITLLLHGLSLPALIHKLWPSGAGAGASAAELSALTGDLLEAANNGIDDALANEPEGQKTADGIAERVRASARNSLAPLAMAHPATNSHHGSSQAEKAARTHLRLARAALDAQRATLIEESAIGRYSSSALRAAELALDAQEARLQPPEVH